MYCKEYILNAHILESLFSQR